MKKITFFIFIAGLVVACHTNDSQNLDDPGPKMVPDHTPYIAGLIEASPDTTFHYPEVIVGYFTDHQSAHAPGILPRHKYKGAYNLTLKRQVVQTSILFALSWQPEPKAVVTVRGPLGTSQEKQVTFSSEGNGVYGDKNYNLPRVADGQYKLQVTISNGRKYVSKTTIPKNIHLALPDSFSTKTYLKHFHDGTPYEQSQVSSHFMYNPPSKGFLTITQDNSNRDRQLLVLKPGQKFDNSHYGNYLRSGLAYRIRKTSNNPQDSVAFVWAQGFNKDRNKIWTSEHHWFRLSFFSPGISYMFFTLYNYYAIGVKWAKYDDVPGHAAVRDDTTYLHRVSTIRKVGEDGKVLPHDSTDAIGFFAGEYSRYLQTTQYANRQFDLDSVLTAYNNK